jgi:hypothetical protein
MRKFNLFSSFFTFLFLMLLFSACDRDIDTRPVPRDLDPGIALEIPSRANFTRRIGEPVELTFRLTDNEALKIFRLSESLYDTDGNPVVVDHYTNRDEPIAGEVLVKNYVYTTPFDISGRLVLPYYTIEVTFYVIDSKGASASTKILIDVLPPIDPPEPFLVREYRNNRIEHPNAFNGREDFNFYNPATSPSVDLDKDIKIVNEVPGPLKGKSLISPNNELRGQDSVFVIIEPARFNYDSCTYTTIKEAWYSGNPIKKKTRMPEVGEYLIIRLAKGTEEQFAVMKPTKVNETSSPARVEFDFKVTN